MQGNTRRQLQLNNATEQPPELIEHQVSDRLHEGGGRATLPLCVTNTTDAGKQGLVWQFSLQYETKQLSVMEMGVGRHKGARERLGPMKSWHGYCLVLPLSFTFFFFFWPLLCFQYYGGPPHNLPISFTGSGFDTRAALPIILTNIQLSSFAF